MLELHENKVINISKKTGFLNMDIFLNNLKNVQIRLPNHMNSKYIIFNYFFNFKF